MTVLRDFPALVAVADELHFGRAALRLGMSQPQLSDVIRRVEARSGVTVFRRRPKVMLTAEGEALVAAARRALFEADSGIALARAIASGLAGVVRLGFAPVALLSGLASALAAFRSSHPDVGLQLVERHSAHLWDDLAAGRLDLIIARETDPGSDLRSTEVLRDPLMIALPQDHPLARLPAISLAEMREEPFVFWARDSAPQYHDMVISACRAAGLDPVISQIVSGWSAILALVAGGFGIALVSASLGRIGFPGVCLRPIVEPMPEARFWLSWSPVRDSAAARRLRNLLDDELRASCLAP